MTPAQVEIIVEIAHETSDAVLVHDGGASVWLNRADVQIFKGDPAPGVATIWLPAALAAEKGLLHESEDAA